MGNTFNKDFKRALDAKLAERGSRSRSLDATANLRNQQAGVIGADSRSAIDLNAANAGLTREKTGLLGREVESLANLRDQNARVNRLGATTDFAKFTRDYDTSKFLSADRDFEGAGIDGASIFSSGSGGQPSYSNYTGGSTAADFGDRPERGSVQDLFGGRVRYANGGIVGAPDSALVAEYDLYREAAGNAGIPALPMREAIPRMAQLRQQKRQDVLDMIAKGGTTPQGYADGGEIDGPGTGKSDSIPAMIDGVQSAAVSDGEFLIPKHVVDYFGTKMFDGLVEKARMAGKANGRKQGYAQGGAVKKPVKQPSEEPLRFKLTPKEVAANNAPLTADDVQNAGAEGRARARFAANAAKPLPAEYAMEGFSGSTYGDLYNHLNAGPGVAGHLQEAYGIGPETRPVRVAAI